MHVTVIVLNWNGKADTMHCLEALHRQTYKEMSIIVVDNGSTDGSAELIHQTYPTLDLIVNADNLGFAEGNNVGIRHALDKGTDAIFLLNNDTDIDPECIEKLVHFSVEHPNAILGARLCRFDERDRLDHLGGFWNGAHANFNLISSGSSFDHNKHGHPISCDFVCGAALFAPTAIWKDVGHLEKRYFLIWEESDFCVRAKAKGYEVIYCPDAIVYHKISNSFVGGKPHTQYFWWRGRLLFMRRNLKKGQYATAIREVIIPELRHILKLYLLKSAQMTLSKALRRKIPEDENPAAIASSTCRCPGLVGTSG